MADRHGTTGKEAGTPTGMGVWGAGAGTGGQKKGEITCR